MQDPKETKEQKAGEEISSEQAEDIGGGAECSPGVTITAGPVVVTGPSVSQVYDNVVDGASHIIETVAKAVKS